MRTAIFMLAILLAPLAAHAEPPGASPFICYTRTFSNPAYHREVVTTCLADFPDCQDARKLDRASVKQGILWYEDTTWSLCLPEKAAWCFTYKTVDFGLSRAMCFMTKKGCTERRKKVYDNDNVQAVPSLCEKTTKPPIGEIRFYWAP